MSRLGLITVVAVAAACSTPRGRTAPPQATPSGPPLVYAAVGASETVGFGAAQPREGWPNLVHHTALPRSAVFVNMGIPGATVARALREAVPATLTVAPALVTVWLNVNDIVAGVDAASFERDLGALVRALRRGGATRVLVANVPPLDRLPAYLACRPGAPAGGPPCVFGAAAPSPEALNRTVDAYDAATQRVVDREGAFLVDLHAVGLAARQAGTEASLVSRDGFHPSSAGHRAVAAAFAEVLRTSGPL